MPWCDNTSWPLGMFFLLFIYIYSTNTYLELHYTHEWSRRQWKKRPWDMSDVSRAQVCFFFLHLFTLLMVILLIECHYTIWGPNKFIKAGMTPQMETAGWNGGGHEMRCVSCPRYIFFLYLIFLIQYSGWTDPTNGQGHEMQHVSCPLYVFLYCL